MHTGHMTTPTPHPFSGASQGGWTTYMQANGWLSCEVMTSARSIKIICTPSCPK